MLKNKFFLSFSLLLFSFGWSVAQSNIEKDIRFFKEKLQKTTAAPERFKLLDTLAILTENNNFDASYENIATKCVELGLELKKYTRTAYQTVSIVYYYNNITGEPEKGIPYANAILEFQDAINWPYQEAMLYLYRGDAYFFSNQNNKAITDYNQAERYFEKLGKKRMATLTNQYRAAAYSKKGELVKAVKDLQKSIKFFKTSKDTFNYVAAKHELSLLFSKYDFFAKAEDQRQKILRLDYSTNAQLASIFLNKSIDLYKQNNFKGFEENLEKALMYAKESNRVEFTVPVIYLVFASKYYENQYPKKAKKYLDLFYKNYDPKNKFTRGYLQETLINKSIVEKRYNYAINLLYKRLEEAKQASDYETIVNAQKKLGKLYKDINQPIAAFTHFERYSILKDSIESDKKLKSLAYYQSVFESKEKDQIIKTKNAQIQILDLKNLNQRKLNWLIGLLGILGISLIYFFFKRQKIKKEKTIHELFAQALLEEREKERLAIAGNLHDSLGQELILIKKRTENLNDDFLTKAISGSIHSLREITRNIYPPSLKRFGLVDAIEDLVGKTEESTALTIDLQMNLKTNLNEKQSLNIYRFLQECLHNTIKHAQASAVKIKIKQKNKKIKIIYNDNGNGFDVAEKLKSSKSFGLKTLRQRAKILKAAFNIKSSQNGTIIALKFSKNNEG
ncbi:tetratricopeptide repeat-containing sensor histidine kinase [Haloflavibacter putidus]|uniref:histidine kinase n=1 Tax=Haloflavibacter putidus TaxID=2576776 RepID=A0A507ZS53_9FLAO|nr:hypothetical protein [Haloflavibacter putidus]TQD39371.1 hypothetical protein FKR84_05605 [Haloflavibacter putidus]